MIGLAGRPSIDALVLVKLRLVSALEGIGSTRELLRQAGMRLNRGRFLGYGLSERMPVHQTLSHAHTRRFVDNRTSVSVSDPERSCAASRVSVRIWSSAARWRSSVSGG
jgi:transposase-like protein DUF772